MRLPDYIRHVGADKFAKSLGVKKRTALSWQYKTRYPNRPTAKRIVEKHPMTMEDIYGS
jgi:DNA-binding transcriptional regulator YiaG